MSADFGLIHFCTIMALTEGKMYSQICDAGEKLWNQLPVNLRKSASEDISNSCVKTHLLKEYIQPISQVTILIILHFDVFFLNILTMYHKLFTWTYGTKNVLLLSLSDMWSCVHSFYQYVLFVNINLLYRLIIFPDGCLFSGHIYFSSYVYLLLVLLQNCIY